MPEGDVTVEFVREKNRGDNKYMVGYTYRKSEGMSYQEMLDSVNMTSDDFIRDTVKFDIQALLGTYESEILFIKSVITDKKQNQSEILKAYKDAKGDGLAGEFSQRSLINALDKLDGKVWKCTRNKTNNAKQYELLPTLDYYSAKYGG